MLLCHPVQTAQWSPILIPAAPREPVEGAFLPVDRVNASLATLYLAGPHAEDWPALAHLEGKLAFAFREGWLFDVWSPI
jgi:hypothetical protein